MRGKAQHRPVTSFPGRQYVSGANRLRVVETVVVVDIRAGELPSLCTAHGRGISAQEYDFDINWMADLYVGQRQEEPAVLEGR